MTFALVLAVRGAALASLYATPLASWHLWTETDEHAYVEWSARLAAGNWRDVPAYRAYFNWQKEYGPPADWERWYQKDAYYSGPGYPYALALVRRTFGAPFLPARLLQLLLACGASAVLAAAVRRASENFLRMGKRDGAEGEAPSSRAAGWCAVAAGVFYGAYAPLVFHDFFLYRDGPVAHLSTLLVALPLVLTGGGAAAFGLGVLGGAAVLVKQTVLPVALFSLYSLSKKSPGGREGGRSSSFSLLLFGLLGLAIPIGTLAARNVSAGVPPFTFDTRQAIGLAWGNGYGADGTTNPPPTMQEILEEAGGSTSKTAKAVLESYEGDRAALAMLMAKKLATFFNAYEVPDNANFYFFRDRLPILGAMPVFACVLGVGLVGLGAALTRRVLRRDEFFLAAVGILAPLASCLLVQTTSRYRAGAIGPLALGTGFLLLFTFEEIRRKDWRRVGVLAAPAAALSLVPLLPSAIPNNKHRFSDTLVYATLVEAQEGPAAAVQEIERYLKEGEDDTRRGPGLASVRYWAESGDRSNTLVEPEGIAPPDRRVRKK